MNQSCRLCTLAKTNQNFMTVRRIRQFGDPCFKPLARNKHGCFNYKDEIIVFGGFGPRAANQFADSSEINDDGQGTIESRVQRNDFV